MNEQEAKVILKKEDIENAGWQLERETSVLENFRYFVEWKGEKHKSDFVLWRLKYQPNDIQIYKYTWEALWPDMKTALFRGKINSKEELETIMKFTKIITHDD